MLVELDEEFIKKLNKKIESNRPSHRKSKILDSSSKYGIILSDLTHVTDKNETIFSIEIKPKWGIICESNFIRDDFKPHKYQFCRYCMHQHLKLQKVSNHQKLNFQFRMKLIELAIIVQLIYFRMNMIEFINLL